MTDNQLADLAKLGVMQDQISQARTAILQNRRGHARQPLTTIESILRKLREDINDEVVE